MAEIFVSYARKNEEQVLEIMQGLASLGYEYWMDRQKIQGGDLWTKVIPQAIDTCRVFLFFVSADSTGSDNVRREIQLAYEKKRKIVIFRLDQTEIPSHLQFALAGIQWIDLSSSDWQPRLVRALEGDTSHQPALDSEPSRQYFATKTNTPQGDPTITNAASSVGSSISDKKAYENENAPTVAPEEHSEGLKKILQIIERMCYNGDLTLEQGRLLKDIFEGVAMKKQKYGEKTMSNISQEFSSSAFLQSSRSLAYYLLSLSDHHDKWPNINLSHKTKDESLDLLRSVQNEVLTSAALIEQVANRLENQDFSFEIEKIISSLHSLRLQFAKIDKHLYTGKPDYDISNEIERHFDDLVYYLNKYILILDSLAGFKGRKLIQ